MPSAVLGRVMLPGIWFALGVLKGRKETRFSVYSSHDVIWRACPDILIRITLDSKNQSQVTLPKNIWKSEPQSPASFSPVDYEQWHCFLEAFVPLGCHLPSVFSFGVRDVLFCCLMSFFPFKMIKFVYSFEIGLCVLCRFVCIFVKLWFWRFIWNLLLFYNRVALVQYLFICCLLFKLMKTFAQFETSLVSIGDLFNSRGKKGSYF